MELSAQPAIAIATFHEITDELLTLDRIPSTLAKSIQRRCEDTGVSESELAIRAIAYYLGNSQPQPISIDFQKVYDLSTEQQFNLASQRHTIQNMSHEKCQELLSEMVEAITVKDNVLRHLMTQIAMGDRSLTFKGDTQNA